MTIPATAVGSQDPAQPSIPARLSSHSNISRRLAIAPPLSSRHDNAASDRTRPPPSSRLTNRRRPLARSRNRDATATALPTSPQSLNTATYSHSVNSKATDTGTQDPAPVLASARPPARRNTVAPQDLLPPDDPSYTVAHRNRARHRRLDDTRSSKPTAANPLATSLPTPPV